MSAKGSDSLLNRYFGHESAPTKTVSSDAVTVDLVEGNLQIVDLAAAAGTVTITINPPPGVGRGTLLIKQDATARDITWAKGTGITDGKWLGDEPTWSSDGTEEYRAVEWWFDGATLWMHSNTEEEVGTGAF